MLELVVPLIFLAQTEGYHYKPSPPSPHAQHMASLNKETNMEKEWVGLGMGGKQCKINK